MAGMCIVIPVFNGWESTERCLRALEASEYREFTTVVVDHGSTDATADILPARFPDVVHLRESESLWWTGATNVGIRWALDSGAAAVVLLNNDCELAPAALATLVGHAERTPGVIAPVQRVAHTGRVLCVSAVPLVALGFPTLFVKRKIPATVPSPAKMICGGRGVLVPVDVFDRVGLLAEEDLPHYLADHDFYLRCRKAGVPLWAAGDADVFVDESRTSVATSPATLSWSEFRATLQNPRSHRNVPSLVSFFRRHYPIRALAPVGVWLNVARYHATWALGRLRPRRRRGDPGAGSGDG
ncbi:MAG: glycosyltransferase family 2 protein [Acidimicrobiia bacterium]